MAADPMLVNHGSPWIVLPPASRTLFESDDTILQVTAVGLHPIAYQWQFNGTNLDSETNATLDLANLQFRQQGNDDCVVSNSLGMSVRCHDGLTSACKTGTRSGV